MRCSTIVAWMTQLSLARSASRGLMCVIRSDALGSSDVLGRAYFRLPSSLLEFHEFSETFRLRKVISAATRRSCRFPLPCAVRGGRVARPREARVVSAQRSEVLMAPRATRKKWSELTLREKSILLQRFPGPRLLGQADSTCPVSSAQTDGRA